MTNAAGMAALLPATVRVSEALKERPDSLFPEEEVAIARAVHARRAEFRTARACARDALAALGVGAVAIGRGPHGEPIWPDGIVGSITHCAGYRAAAVARRSDLAAVGLDAEPDWPLPVGVFPQVATAQERNRLTRLPPACQVDRGRLLFSIKEAVYKAWFPLTGCWLDFHQVEVDVDPAGRFQATVDDWAAAVTGGIAARFTGRWAVARGLVLAAVAVPTAGESRPTTER